MLINLKNCCLGYDETPFGIIVNMQNPVFMFQLREDIGFYTSFFAVALQVGNTKISSPLLETIIYRVVTIFTVIILDLCWQVVRAVSSYPY